MTGLHEAMRDALDGWSSDLAAPWRAFFAGAEPDFDAIGQALNFDSAQPVIPSRKGAPLVGAPVGAHIFRAFDGVAPAAVRVVIVGQDPYPRVSRATGRAFEDGALTAWTAPVAVSLQHLLQSALALRLGRPELAADGAGWNQICRDIAEGVIQLEPLSAYFDRLQTMYGVLFVNAGWTLTRFAPGGGPEQKAHIAMWRPLMTRLINGLCARDEGCVVFLLLGSFAQRLFVASGAQDGAMAVGTWGTRVRAIAHPHPNAPAYFQTPNPLGAVNGAIAEMNAEQVRW